MLKKIYIFDHSHPPEGNKLNTSYLKDLKIPVIINK